MSYCGDFSEVMSTCLVLLCRPSGKRAFLFLNDPKPKGWEKIGNISLENHDQILEETRKIHYPVQFRGRKQNLKDNEQTALQYSINKDMLLKHHFSL